jgi:hypothetical protein
MGLESIELTLSKDEIRKRENETFFITDLEEVKTQFGKRWKLSIEDKEGNAWVVFISEKEIKKLIIAYGRDKKLIKGQGVKFRVVPIKIMGQEKEMIELVI